MMHRIDGGKRKALVALQFRRQLFLGGHPVRGGRGEMRRGEMRNGVHDPQLLR